MQLPVSFYLIVLGMIFGFAYLVVDSIHTLRHQEGKSFLQLTGAAFGLVLGALMGLIAIVAVFMCIFGK
jgi:hypothetical protein